jgi:hypothetical protein
MSARKLPLRNEMSCENDLTHAIKADDANDNQQEQSQIESSMFEGER